MNEEPRRTDALVVAASLADSVRRRLYAFVCDATEPVGRDEAATAAGIGRSLAGYHLDQLVDQGLLSVTYSRRGGRSGPGAGRPAKLYGAADVEVTVQLPPRDDALPRTCWPRRSRPSRPVQHADRCVPPPAPRGARSDVSSRVNPWPASPPILKTRGYAPMAADDGIRLRNCPFHHLVGDHLDLVCTLNNDLLGAAVNSARVG